MKIKIKYHNPLCEIIQYGDWIDLKAAKSIKIKGPKIKNNKVLLQHKLIPLGVSMKLPKYMEAIVVPRSSIYGSHNIIQANHVGIIDNAYSGNDDEWKMSVIALKDTIIHETDRICQFRIQLSQNAPWWAKLKWLFSKKINFKVVDDLSDKNRGGFGSTNKKSD